MNEEILKVGKLANQSKGFLEIYVVTDDSYMRKME
jgi:hypothetical protein